MNKETKKIVPELRFPEFMNDGEWVEQNLGSLVNIKSGYSPSKYNLKNVGKYPFVKVEDLNNCDKYQLKSREYSNDTKNIIPKYSVIFPKRGAAIQLNKVRLNKVGILIDTNLMAITPNDEIKVEFLYYIIVKVGLYKIADTSIIPQINNKHIEPYKVVLPTAKEQQKIASCLSSLDEVIYSYSQKLETLKDHKKGLMQNLFPQEGETVPKYRFPEFVKYGEWGKKELANFCMNISSGKDKNTIDGEFELYGSTGIIGRSENANYEGDFILVARVGANAGLLNRVKGKFGVTDNTLVLDLKKEEVVDFVYYSLENIGLNKMVFGSGQPLITGGQLKSLNLFIPPKPQEQQKIADCLSSLDELITAQDEKIEQLKLHKKGLMQVLFLKVND